MVIILARDRPKCKTVWLLHLKDSDPNSVVVTLAVERSKCRPTYKTCGYYTYRYVTDPDMKQCGYCKRPNYKPVWLSITLATPNKSVLITLARDRPKYKPVWLSITLATPNKSVVITLARDRPKYKPVWLSITPATPNKSVVITLVRDRSNSVVIYYTYTRQTPK